MKMNQKIKMALAVAGVVFTAQQAQAQAYEMLHDNPLSYHKLIVNFNLIELDLASPTTYRFGLGGEFNLNQKLYFHSDFNLGVFDFVDGAVKGKQTEFEAGGIYSFASKTKVGKGKFEFNHNHEKYKATLKCNILKQYGVHAGVHSFSTPKKHDGDYVSFTNATSIFAGFSVMRTKSFLVDIDGYGTYDRESRGKFYVDAMFAPVISLADNTDYASYIGSASTATPANFPDLVKNHMGVRVGYMKRNNRPIPIRQGFEAGIRPGVGNGMYFLMKISISVGFIEGKTTPKE